VVLADHRGRFVQEVFSGIGDAGVHLLEFGFDLAAHVVLRLGEALLMLLETIKRRNKTPVTHRGNADARDRWMQRRLDFPLGLNADRLLAAVRGDGDVFRRAEDVPAVAGANPAEFRQEDSGIALIDLEALRNAKTIAPTFFLGAWKISVFFKEVWAGLFRDRFVQCFLRCQCLVVDKSARPCETAQVALLLSVRFTLELVGLQTFYRQNHTLSVNQPPIRQLCCPSS
jgi:hypothetical protein